MNVRFEYLYRDYGNFKNRGEIIFANPNNLTTDDITKMAGDVLIQEASFVAYKANVPDLHFKEYGYDEELDHGWHEFHLFALTEETPNDLLGRNIEEFIKSLRLASKI